MKKISLTIFLIANCIITHAKDISIREGDTIIIYDTVFSSEMGQVFVPITLIDTPSLIVAFDSAQAPKHKTKKLIAAVLAFPFPFGMLGLHRIYLGTKPYMPFAYIGTLGGCLGILPLIDFITILAADEEMLGRYRNNPKVIMWSH
ncbi:MAG: TM2 domain-containing protein [Bacteroidetes bacterium]|nr:TM2 domain-containing protein [Bacteroidota bacterium]